MNYDPTEWVSPNIAGMIARRLGIPHSNDRVKAQMQAEKPATVRRKSERRDEVMLGPYLDMARMQSDAQRAIEAEAEERRKAREAARAQVEEGHIDNLRRELREARKWAAQADIDRQAALTECERLRTVVMELRETLRLISVTSHAKTTGAQLKQEGKAND